MLAVEDGDDEALEADALGVADALMGMVIILDVDPEVAGTESLMLPATVEATVPSARVPWPQGIAEPSACTALAGAVTAPVVEAIVNRVVHCGSRPRCENSAQGRQYGCKEVYGRGETDGGSRWRCWESQQGKGS